MLKPQWVFFKIVNQGSKFIVYFIDSKIFQWLTCDKDYEHLFYFITKTNKKKCIKYMFLIFNNYMYQCICRIHCHSVLLHVDVTNYSCGSLSVQLICHIHFLFNPQSLTSMHANCFSNPDNLKEVLQNG